MATKPKLLKIKRDGNTITGYVPPHLGSFQTTVMFADRPELGYDPYNHMPYDTVKYGKIGRIECLAS